MYRQTFRKSLWLLTALLLAVAAWTVVPAQTVRAACGDSDPRTVLCVDADATGGVHNGLSWTTAFTNVQDALDLSNATSTTDYEIWVAEGVYYPDEDTDGGHVNNSRSEYFTLDYNNVQLYGGFAATETLRSQRDWATNLAILSGDVDNNDTNTDGDYINESYTHIQGSNAYHVLYLDGTTNEPITSTTVIDGFVVTGGYAWLGYNAFPLTNGGGLFCHGEQECSPSLTNLIIIGNMSRNAGGGIYNYGGNGNASPSLTNVVVSNNNSNNGGGGGIMNDGAFGISSPTLVNVTISGNSGGGVRNESYVGVSAPSFVNVIAWGNASSQVGGYSSSAPSFKNCIVQGGIGSYTDLGGNLDQDPLFVDAASGDVTVQAGSPALDNGSTADLPADSTDFDGDGNTTEPIPYDLGHNDRVLDSAVDIGAYENSPNVAPVAADDTYSITEDNVPSTLDVLANDDDDNGDALTIDSVGMPTYDSVAISGTTELVYTPTNRTATYTDTFAYTISDGALIDSATVTVTVTADNDPPTLPDLTMPFVLNEEDVVGGQVPGSDPDEDDTLIYGVVAGPVYGEISINLSGYGSFTTANRTADYTDTITFIITDTGGLSDTGTFTYPVLADNDAPVVLDDVFDVAQNGSLSVPAAGVLANDVDPDEDGPGLTVTVEDVPTGDLALNPDGSFTYTPTLDFTGEDSFTYVASDSVMTATGTVTLNVAGPTQEIVAVSGAGTYPFGSICGSITFTSTGTVDTFTVTLAYGYPSVNGDGLPRRYDIEVDGSGFNAMLTLCYEDNDLLVAGIAPTREPNLHAYRYVGSGQPWAEYSQVDTVNNTVTAFEVTEFGVWGLGVTFDQPTALAINSLRARGGLWAMGLVTALGLAIIYPRRKRR